ncbi:cytochrome c [Marinovum sp. 2_MG-2023]|uniref:c-type cytochrome n=1 Tax=unclassified Marinovum TaxID=2647166 RepID=UPI0026E1F726|nr:MULTISPECIES: cytochrome c [unclassified Marinovum]MDO6731543.1 cytochrome c [Marinovum sp. 2_MG-2023]MDO6780903.1 cytochrome c [Marinovum sp. 1_MG-2023]
MRRQIPCLILCALVGGTLAGMALAHSGVKDRHVKARMHGMSEMARSVGTLADMARGKTEFDADKAKTARAALLQHAAEIPEVFETKASDPKSEARPKIWRDWNDFAAQAMALETAITALDVTNVDMLRAGIGPIGRACGACHMNFRLEK